MASSRISPLSESVLKFPETGPVIGCLRPGPSSNEPKLRDGTVERATREEGVCIVPSESETLGEARMLIFPWILRPVGLVFTLEGRESDGGQWHTANGPYQRPCF